MAAKVPTTYQIAWIALIPFMLFPLLSIFICYKLGIEEFILWGTVIYLIIALGLRRVIAKNFRQGMKLVKQQQFSNAIPFFEKSVDFFNRNKWVDKFRSITLLSASKMTYKEMGLCNIAFCYSQIGDGQKAKEYYERTLNEFPNNILAITALKMINSIEQISKKTE